MRENGPYDSSTNSGSLDTVPSVFVCPVLIRRSVSLVGSIVTPRCHGEICWLETRMVICCFYFGRLR